jgi:hypothetical protein
VGTVFSKFSEIERAALIELLGTRRSWPKDQSSLGNLELRGKLFERILEAVTGKASGEAIASELRPGRGQGARKSNTAPSERIVDVIATAPEIGRFFLKHHFDGRALKRDDKPASKRLKGRRGNSLGLVQRSDDLLLVVLLNLADDTPVNFDDDLCVCLDRALNSFQGLQPSTAKPQSRAR